MTVVLVAIAVAVVFVLALAKSGLVGQCRRGLEYVQEAAGTIRDKRINDHEKQRRVQRASVQLFITAGQILLRGGAVLFVSFVPILLADLLNLSKMEVIFGWFTRLDIFLGGSFAATVGYFLVKSKWPLK